MGKLGVEWIGPTLCSGVRSREVTLGAGAWACADTGLRDVGLLFSKRSPVTPPPPPHRLFCRVTLAHHCPYTPDLESGRTLVTALPSVE